jgi:hypothetical protein
MVEPHKSRLFLKPIIVLSSEDLPPLAFRPPLAASHQAEEQSD